MSESDRKFKLDERLDAKWLRLAALESHDWPDKIEALRALIREQELPFTMVRTGQPMTEAENNFIRAAMAKHEASGLCGTMQLRAHEEFEEAFKKLMIERKSIIAESRKPKA
jgi:hypothetical protein